jgi:hypothetical protein
VLLNAPSGTGAPIISGGTTVGSALLCSQGAWAPELLAALDYLAPQGFAYSWSENGTPIAGASTSSITASTPGSYSCTVTASNQAGSTAQSSAAVTIAASAPALTPSTIVVPLTPILSGLSETAKTWREGSALAAISKKKNIPPARYNILLCPQRVGNRDVQGRNEVRRTDQQEQAQAPLHPHGDRRHAHVLRARRHEQGALRGLISRHKKLKPGNYTLAITAIDAEGAHSPSKSLRFTIDGQ